MLKIKLLFIITGLFFLHPSYAQIGNPVFHFEVSFEGNQSNTYEVTMVIDGLHENEVQIKMPVWMPGYYQIMDYGQYVAEIGARDENNQNIDIVRIDQNTWNLNHLTGKQVIINYKVKTKRKFVANSYVDEKHGYLVPGNSFMYIEGYLSSPVSVQVNLPSFWSDVVTGLEQVTGQRHVYSAPDFDILYDCPLLVGNLDSLPTFYVESVPHRFIGYDIGSFDQKSLVDKLSKVVKTSIDIFDDIPYNEYSFIAIGPGRGGIEHLNNATISFSGNNLDDKDAMNSMINFLAHEYFHHFNVKRIRPFELGPFDYGKGNRTNLLWISEGLTVYYEYLVVKRAGLIDLSTFLSFFENHINVHESDAGRHYQTLQQSSYNTWSDGPFGNRGNGPDRTISYYNKGPIVGLILDLEIRHLTENERSLDDVMRHLYTHYYKEENRGFTDAEFQSTCESIAGSSLDHIFEYVYTTKEFDYNRYLKYAGLHLNKVRVEKKDGDMAWKYNLKVGKKLSKNQVKLLNYWMGK